MEKYNPKKISEILRLSKVSTKNEKLKSFINEPEKWSDQDWRAFLNNPENQKLFMQLNNEVIGKTT